MTLFSSRLASQFVCVFLILAFILPFPSVTFAGGDGGDGSSADSPSESTSGPGMGLDGKSTDSKDAPSSQDSPSESTSGPGMGVDGKSTDADNRGGGDSPSESTSGPGMGLDGQSTADPDANAPGMTSGLADAVSAGLAAAAGFFSGLANNALDAAIGVAQSLGNALGISTQTDSFADLGYDGREGTNSGPGNPGASPADATDSPSESTNGPGIGLDGKSASAPTGPSEATSAQKDQDMSPTAAQDAKNANVAAVMDQLNLDPTNVATIGVVSVALGKNTVSQVVDQMKAYDTYAVEAVVASIAMDTPTPSCGGCDEAAQSLESLMGIPDATAASQAVNAAISALSPTTDPTVNGPYGFDSPAAGVAPAASVGQNGLSPADIGTNPGMSVDSPSTAAAPTANDQATVDAINDMTDGSFATPGKNQSAAISGLSANPAAANTVSVTGLQALAAAFSMAAQAAEDEGKLSLGVNPGIFNTDDKVAFDAYMDAVAPHQAAATAADEAFDTAYAANDKAAMAAADEAGKAAAAQISATISSHFGPTADGARGVSYSGTSGGTGQSAGNAPTGPAGNASTNDGSSLGQANDEGAPGPAQAPDDGQAQSTPTTDTTQDGQVGATGNTSTGASTPAGTPTGTPTGSTGVPSGNTNGNSNTGAAPTGPAPSTNIGSAPAPGPQGVFSPGNVGSYDTIGVVNLSGDGTGTNAPTAAQAAALGGVDFSATDIAALGRTLAGEVAGSITGKVSRGEALTDDEVAQAAVTANVATTRALADRGVSFGPFNGSISDAVTAGRTGTNAGQFSTYNANSVAQGNAAYSRNPAAFNALARGLVDGSIAKSRGLNVAAPVPKATHYFNPDVANPTWGPQLSDAQTLGTAPHSHVAGTLGQEYSTVGDVEGVDSLNEDALAAANKAAETGLVDGTGLTSDPIGMTVDSLGIAQAPTNNVEDSVVDPVTVQSFTPIGNGNGTNPNGTPAGTGAQTGTAGATGTEDGDGGTGSGNGDSGDGDSAGNGNGTSNTGNNPGNASAPGYQGTPAASNGTGLCDCTNVNITGTARGEDVNQSYVDTMNKALTALQSKYPGLSVNIFSGTHADPTFDAAKLSKADRAALNAGKTTKEALQAQGKGVPSGRHAHGNGGDTTFSIDGVTVTDKATIADIAQTLANVSPNVGIGYNNKSKTITHVDFQPTKATTVWGYSGGVPDSLATAVANGKAGDVAEGVTDPDTISGTGATPGAPATPASPTAPADDAPVAEVDDATPQGPAGRPGPTAGPATPAVGIPGVVAPTNEQDADTQTDPTSPTVADDTDEPTSIFDSITGFVADVVDALFGGNETDGVFGNNSSNGTTTYTNLPSTQNYSAGTGTDSLGNASTESVRPYVTIYVTVNETTGETQFERGDVQYPNGEIYTEEDESEETYGTFDDTLKPLIISTNGNIIYSDGTYAPRHEAGVPLGNDEIDYVYITQRIVNGQLMDAETNEDALPQESFFETIGNAFSDTTAFTIADIDEVVYVYVDTDTSITGNEYKDYTITLSDGSEREITLPVTASLSYYQEKLYEIGYRGNALALIGMAVEVERSLTEKGEGLFTQIFNGVVDTASNIMSFFGFGDDDEITIQPYNGATFTFDDIVTLTLHLNIPVVCPLTGSTYGYIYEIEYEGLDENDESAVRSDVFVRCGAGGPLTYATEIAAHLQNEVKFEAVDPSELLEIMEFNYNTPQ